ncbi:uncharacterized protein BXZ73DRAFT_98445 [Epithele typhae]|uniref:uncharacterized protein n=1 Tax=Epithele typhae TaxID=378194 RepID=UPI00200728B7|nr:uncharacterized protein BXZ73DRAFT_98445 [Epithele typhae]KAH9941231.1 hypothetical protein BXZ73DRAFT_98445 [Epithele typhae]
MRTVSVHILLYNGHALTLLAASDTILSDDKDERLHNLFDEVLYAAQLQLERPSYDLQVSEKDIVVDIFETVMPLVANPGKTIVGQWKALCQTLTLEELERQAYPLYPPCRSARIKNPNNLIGVVTVACPPSSWLRSIDMRFTRFFHPHHGDVFLRYIKRFTGGASDQAVFRADVISMKSGKAVGDVAVKFAPLTASKVTNCSQSASSHLSCAANVRNAVAILHEHDLVFGDLRPGNLIAVAGEDRVVLIDFDWCGITDPQQNDSQPTQLDVVPEENGWSIGKSATIVFYTLLRLRYTTLTYFMAMIQTDAVTLLHKDDFVFGNLRRGNLIAQDDGRVMLVDFDWCGKCGDAKYPLDINLDPRIPWNTEVRPGALIKKDHDLYMLQRLHNEVEILPSTRQPA